MIDSPIVPDCIVIAVVNVDCCTGCVKNHVFRQLPLRLHHGEKKTNLAAVSANRSFGVAAWRSVIPATTSSSCEASASITVRRQSATLAVVSDPPAFEETVSHRITTASAAACQKHENSRQTVEWGGGRGGGGLRRRIQRPGLREADRCRFIACCKLC